MADFLLGAASFVLAMVALGLVRVLWGPSDADRIMAAQLLGTGGIAALLLLARAMGVPSAVDVALILALLAAFVALNALTILAVCAGALFFLAGTAGLLRFPDALGRLHALTKADNLGLGLVMLGLLFQEEALFTALKLIAVWILALLAGATVTQLIARTARPGGVPD
jgi:multicomponent Na+:H+ antiporter subunit G